MRILCLVAIAVMLAGVGSLATPHPADAQGSASTVPPVAIDLGGIFGDENEPDEDENEGDEGGSEDGRPAARQVDHGSGLPLPLVVLIAILGVIGAGFVVNRVRRLVSRVRRLRARLRGWGRDLTRTRR